MTNSKKRVLILNGHPADGTISEQLAEAYADEARATGADFKVVQLKDLEFDMDFGVAKYADHKPLEPALQEVSEAFFWCSDLVLLTPMWWGGLPAKLKGLIDRVFLPGVYFVGPKDGALPKPLLTGRRARVIVTSDSPWWYFRFFIHRALYWQLKVQILGFVGFKPLRFTHFSTASHPKPGNVARWIARVRKIARRDLH